MSCPPDRRPLKVCCVIGALTAGGSEQQMVGILHELDRRQIQPHLFTFYQHGPLVSQVPPDVPHFCYEQHVGKPTSGWVPGRIQRALAQRLATYCTEQQIDVIYDRTYHVSLVTGAAGRRSGIPYVNTIVENPEVGFYSTAGPLGRLKYYQLRRVYRRAAQVVCVSRGLVSASAKFFGLPESMFACCYNFVDQRRMRTIEVARQHRPPCPPPTLIPPLGTAERPLKIIGVGRLHWQKGLDNLLRAIATLVQQHRLAVELTLVGDGPERQALQTLAAELGLAQQVRFEGWKPDPSQDVAHSDLFALPSLAEGLPNSLLEALLIGTPAIAADCRFGPAELAEDGKWATLLPGHNPTVWAAAIARFAASPWADIDRACRARAVLERRFDASQGCAQLQAILQRAAGGVAKDA